MDALGSPVRPGWAWGGPSGWISWVSSQETTPGIGQASIFYVGTAFVVWSDFDGAGAQSSTPTKQGIVHRGHLRSNDGRQVAFEYQTEGETGQVTIDGESYALADGNLFLVSKDGARPRVRQLKRDLAKLDFQVVDELDELKAFARDDAEIVAFFTEGSK